jgi:NADH-quinone oxidoreductase subunit K
MVWFQLITCFFSFSAGILGILFRRRDIIIVLVCIELMLLSVGLLIIIFAGWMDDFTGQIVAIFILTVAAAESAVGLGLIIGYYRIKGDLKFEEMTFIRG